MVSRFRSAVMWLLLVALPLQAYAAVTMLSCGPNHHRLMVAATAMGEPAEPYESHGHIAAGQHHHETGMVGGPLDVASADGSGAASSLSHRDKLMKFKCNACAVCCTGAAMPTAVFTFEPFPPAMAPASSVPITHVGFVTHGPDRPPRLSYV